MLALDADSHEMIPLQFWGEVFDEAIADKLAKANIKMFTTRAENSLSRPDITGDEAEITEETVWTMKGPGAPGAIDFNRRLDVLDAMQVDRQLVFPTFGLLGYSLYCTPNAPERLGYDPADLDRITVGRDIIDAHNRWAARITKTSDSRLRPVAIVLTDSVPQMMSDLEAAIENGCRAVMIPAGIPPADTSPADVALDPFWRLLAESNTPVTVHIGTESAFLASTRWGANVPEFVPSLNSSLEFPIEPHRAANVHYAADNFLAAMILGGVFERHPTLRFGVIELSAEWIGPLSARLDTLAQEFGKRLSTLSLCPSEYISRNVRVTPFYYEAIDDVLSRYPSVADVLVYASDYPHREGGKYPKTIFETKLANFSPEIRSKFMTENGQLLMPN
jgi:predicted TIM-barrel fold metal-dependent hydrolase